jgi:hypothetical protein
MPLHPQIAALAARLEDLVNLLRANGERLWSGRIDLIRHLVADSNFAGVERFLRLFEGEEGLQTLALADASANERLVELRQSTQILAQRLAKEEGAD